MNLKKLVTSFMIILTFAVTILVLYVLWSGEGNMQLIIKAVISYFVITVSFYMTIKYVEVLEGDKKSQSEKSKK